MQNSSQNQSNKPSSGRGGRPRLPQDERVDRRKASMKKYTEGKKRINIPLTQNVYDRFYALKDTAGYKNNDLVLEKLIRLGEQHGI